MWKNIRRIESSDKNVLKFVFEGNDAVAEAVLYKYPTYEERTVMCVSTQSGCPIGCRFCGAGDSFVRSLTGPEIVYQVEHLLDDTGVDPKWIDKFQIMFMSMGEPMLNLNALEHAIRYLHAAYPKAALLVSTSAPDIGYDNYNRFIELSKEVPTVGLQFSVHESTDEARDRLIPFKSKLKLWEISNLGATWRHETGRKLFFNYCAHEGNTSQEDADRLRSMFEPEDFEATISVVCERDEHVAAANARQRDLATGFRAKLGQHGFNTRVFDPAGQDDIGGGCGQLWFVQDWMKQHGDVARPSTGRRLPVIHAPR